MTDKSRLNGRLQGIAISSLLAAIGEAEAARISAGLLQQALREYDEGGSEVPDIIANAAANVLFKDHIGFPTDGTFTVTRDGETSPVEYPLTFYGLVNASNEAAGGGVIGFKPGPDGPYASVIKRTEEEAAIRQASALLGEPGSPAYN